MKKRAADKTGEWNRDVSALPTMGSARVSVPSPVLVIAVDPLERDGEPRPGFGLGRYRPFFPMAALPLPIRIFSRSAPSRFPEPHCRIYFVNSTVTVTSWPLALSKTRELSPPVLAIDWFCSRPMP
jgi:hypothetical protein